MRSLIVGLVAAGLGIACGWWATQAEFRIPDNPIPVSPTEVRPGFGRVAVEGEETFDFGMMNVDQPGSHTFIIKNIGDGPLRLTAGKTTCKCTISNVAGGDVLPGESREVFLEWKSPHASEQFQQTAPIHTNDPDRPTVDLVVRGKIRETLLVDPSPASIGSFSVTDVYTYDINVWSFHPEPWEYRSFTMTPTEMSSFFEIKARDMTAEELEKRSGALNGQVLRITIRPGMRLGKLHAHLKLTHNYEEHDALNLELYGNAVGDINIIGPDFESERDYFNLGNIPREQGRKVKAFLIVKGPHRDDVKLSVQSIDPETTLQATLGEPTKLNNSVRWPITIEIPPGSPAVNRLGSEIGRLARIELETQHPTIPIFTIKVRMAVVDE